MRSTSLGSHNRRKGLIVVTIDQDLKFHLHVPKAVQDISSKDNRRMDISSKNNFGRSITPMGKTSRVVRVAKELTLRLMLLLGMRTRLGAVVEVILDGAEVGTDLLWWGKDESSELTDLESELCISQAAEPCASWLIQSGRSSIPSGYLGTLQHAHGDSSAQQGSYPLFTSTTLLGTKPMTYVPTEVCLISDDKLRHCQCKSSRAVEAKIHKLWSQYVDGFKKGSEPGMPPLSPLSFGIEIQNHLANYEIEVDA
ncbi:hypothetical protein LSH36_41g13080 [Paralvinella palmiformis]|uniref:Uncharacterized protein n=1 Tax=Paralvinella palmiformis TaxID=53620 RepID=A0AAD9NF18_9ANNE|nr:hypothetical protein LSH36_41g13080 [Paralvinella palmiformis]